MRSAIGGILDYSALSTAPVSSTVPSIPVLCDELAGAIAALVGIEANDSRVTALMYAIHKLAYGCVKAEEKLRLAQGLTQL
jgi:hypothetical protein